MHERCCARLVVHGAATSLQSHGSVWRMLQRGETRSKSDGWNQPGRLKSESAWVQVSKKGSCVCFSWQPLCFFFWWAGVLFVSLSATSLFKSPLFFFPFSDSPCVLELSCSPSSSLFSSSQSHSLPQTVEGDTCWSHLAPCFHKTVWHLSKAAMLAPSSQTLCLVPQLGIGHVRWAFPCQLFTLLWVYSVSLVSAHVWPQQLITPTYVKVKKVYFILFNVQEHINK